VPNCRSNPSGTLVVALLCGGVEVPERSREESVVERGWSETSFGKLSTDVWFPKRIRGDCAGYINLAGVGGGVEDLGTCARSVVRTGVWSDAGSIWEDVPDESTGPFVVLVMVHTTNAGINGTCSERITIHTT
jgi:hypothetical protein